MSRQGPGLRRPLYKGVRISQGTPMPELSPVRAGDVVRIRDAMGEYYIRQATSGPQMGGDFPVIWVATTLHDPEALPWPVEDVEPWQNGGSE